MTATTPYNMKQALLRVPEVTLVFWIIKTLSTTVGETGADFLAVGLNWGMPITTVLMVGIMAVLLYVQFAKYKRYVPANYWALVVLMSVIGTLITDILVDLAGVSLVTLSVVFTVMMLAGFYFWYREEGTMSIHSIDTGKREAWYWVVILLAFALGTGVGDLISEHFRSTQSATQFRTDDPAARASRCRCRTNLGGRPACPRAALASASVQSPA